MRITRTAAEIRRAGDLGCYFSVNAEMLANEKRAVANRAFPLGRVLTETRWPVHANWCSPIGAR
ncbi:TatD-related deoxyribonuclease [Hyphomicrobium denitrificans 1NES1]|uniref:TatD-related deoxyribonuclease n=1 Tax=Hyphomicrobium denitrificans 1NES1 TaxID=670307 RepID=N0BBT5_9HYPH|nr:TatD-related deoxyribonuclease [Hyphomicrobium denitrificans 1NES1]